MVVEGGRKTDRPGSAYRPFDSIKNDCPIRRGLHVRPFIGHGLFSLSFFFFFFEEESFQDRGIRGWTSSQCGGGGGFSGEGLSMDRIFEVWKSVGGGGGLIFRKKRTVIILNIQTSPEKLLLRTYPPRVSLEKEKRQPASVRVASKILRS